MLGIEARNSTRNEMPPAIFRRGATRTMKRADPKLSGTANARASTDVIAVP